MDVYLVVDVIDIIAVSRAKSSGLHGKSWMGVYFQGKGEFNGKDVTDRLGLEEIWLVCEKTSFSLQPVTPILYSEVINISPNKGKR